MTRRRSPIQASYHIHGSVLQVVKGGKYLGVTINEKMSWNTHASTTAKKANNSLAFLRRNLASCPQNIKAQCYQTLVRPILDYASSSWDPHTKANVTQLEAVQRRAARFVKGDYRTTSSTSQMIADLGWQTLQERRTNSKLVMTYRILHGLVEIPKGMFFHPTAINTRGNPAKYMLPSCHSDVYLHSFFPSAIRLWNRLPVHLATLESVEGFKRSIMP